VHVPERRDISDRELLERLAHILPPHEVRLIGLQLQDQFVLCVRRQEVVPRPNLLADSLKYRQGRGLLSSSLAPTSGVCREVPVCGHRVAHDAVVRHLHLPVTLAHSLMRLIDVPSIDVTYGA
jgi:hypothetical protein